MNPLEKFTKMFSHYTFRGALALIIIGGGFAYLFALLRWEIPEGNKEASLQAQGFVLGLMALAAGWYFGSSKDRADLDKVEHAKSLSAREYTTTTSQIPDPISPTYELVAPHEIHSKTISEEDYIKLQPEEQALYKKKE